MPRKPKRQRVQECVLSCIDLEGDLDITIENLNRYKQDYSEEYLNLFLEQQTCHCWGDCGGCSRDYELWGDRLENDTEYNKRLAGEKKAREKKKAKREAKLAKEREEYERLKKKFGD